ncbi:MAG: NAD(P)-dependent oxidoreductase [bacterium]|nr:NAD(P)-dependent oxidoreductase [bacterium]
MARTVAVFGGTGFIGEYAVRELKRRGAACVVINAATRRDVMSNAIADAAHIMWLIPAVPGLLKSFAREISTAPRLEKFLYASTMLLYGGDVPQNEHAPLRPCTDYERAKYAEEGIIRDMFAKHPERLVVARFANVYGDVKNRGVIGKIFSALRDGSTFIVNGDGSQRRDHIHVADAARLATDILLTPAAHGIYNVSTGAAHSLRELIGKIERVTGKKVKVTWSDSIEEKHMIVADPAKLKKLLKRVAMRSLDEGLEETHKRYAL